MRANILPNGLPIVTKRSRRSGYTSVVWLSTPTPISTPTPTPTPTPTSTSNYNILTGILILVLIIGCIIGCIIYALNRNNLKKIQGKV